MIFLAAADLAYTPPAVPEAPGFGYLVVRLLILTGFVIALCVGLLWVSRKYQRSARPGSTSGPLEYTASVQLDRRCALHLLKADQQAVVIGTDLVGIKAMVVLPDGFDEALSGALKSPTV